MPEGSNTLKVRLTFFVQITLYSNHPLANIKFSLNLWRMNCKDAVIKANCFVYIGRSHIHTANFSTYIIPVDRIPRHMWYFMASFYTYQFTLGLQWDLCYSMFRFMCIFRRLLFVTDSDCSVGIFKLYLHLEYLHRNKTLIN